MISNYLAVISPNNSSILSHGIYQNQLLFVFRLWYSLVQQWLLQVHLSHMTCFHQPSRVNSAYLTAASLIWAQQLLNHQLTIQDNQDSKKWTTSNTEEMCCLDWSQLVEAVVQYYLTPKIAWNMTAANGNSPLPEHRYGIRWFRHTLCGLGLHLAHRFRAWFPVRRKVRHCKTGSKTTIIVFRVLVLQKQSLR